MVDKNQIDPELLVALEDVLDFDIWEDLTVTRLRRQELAEKYKAHLPIMEHVVFADHLIPDAGDNPDYSCGCSANTENLCLSWSRYRLDYATPKYSSPYCAIGIKSFLAL